MRTRVRGVRERVVLEERRARCAREDDGAAGFRRQGEVSDGRVRVDQRGRVAPVAIRESERERVGVEVVLPNGDILDLIRTLRKDNTGYDLKQIFIGAEGTLGVVTKVAIMTRAPLSVNVALFGLKTFVQCAEMLKLARARLGEILSAFEFFDKESRI